MAGRGPEEHVGFPLLNQRWRHVAFLHWRYEPGVLQNLLPEGLEIDSFDGAAWVSMTPLVIEGARPPLIPAIPGLSSFPETNVRTYVHGPTGRDGLWFFTLEAHSLLTVISSRLALGVPYRWADMDVRHDGGCRTYRSRRRGAREIGHRITIQPEDPPVAADDALAHWLTGRWRAWTKVAGQLVTVPVQHEAWPLHPALVIELDETLLSAVGLPGVSEDPLVHFAAEVDAKLGWPTRRGAGGPGR